MKHHLPTPAKLEALMKSHAAVIASTRRELAMNFDVPARDIIGMACAEMGISVRTWDAMESYARADRRAGRREDDPCNLNLAG